ncbi:tryptophan synthase beta subunit-like PLP-dependent enzyme [Trichophaea hybrida]|nr:tryptophan synthase beta subunit-like PLP-dependent enzyme [Trichophaea hybrida]
MTIVSHSSESKLPWIHTPLLESAALSKVAGCRIFMKMDLFQPSGSFKSRGVGNLILKSISSAAPAHVYSSSGGNAGLAAVIASRSLGAACSVIVPSSTNEFMKSKLLAAGAEEVITHGASWVEADAFTHLLVQKDPNGVYCSPFDHPDVWEGNSSIVDEILEDMEMAPDAVVASVGGGGLLMGLVVGLERHGLGKQVKVVGVETEGADSLFASLKAGKLVTLPAITSIATSLGARTVAVKAFEAGRKENVISQVVTDGMAARACVRFAEDERVLVEAACGASLAVVYELGLRKIIPALTTESKVVVVVCGGSNINIEMLQQYKREYQVHNG